MDNLKMLNQSYNKYQQWNIYRILRFNASFKYPLSGLILIKYFAMKNNTIFITIKSIPYNDCANNESELFAVKIVKYGINEKTNIKTIFNQITLESIFSTC